MQANLAGTPHCCELLQGAWPIGAQQARVMPYSIFAPGRRLCPSAACPQELDAGGALQQDSLCTKPAMPQTRCMQSLHSGGHLHSMQPLQQAAHPEEGLYFS